MQTKLGRRAETEYRCVFKGVEHAPAVVLAFSHNKLLSAREKNTTKQA